MPAIGAAEARLSKAAQHELRRARYVANTFACGDDAERFQEEARIARLAAYVLTQDTPLKTLNCIPGDSEEVVETIYRLLRDMLDPAPFRGIQFTNVGKALNEAALVKIRLARDSLIQTVRTQAQLRRTWLHPPGRPVASAVAARPRGCDSQATRLQQPGHAWNSERPSCPATRLQQPGHATGTSPS